MNDAHKANKHHQSCSHDTAPSLEWPSFGVCPTNPGRGAARMQIRPPAAGTNAIRVGGLPMLRSASRAWSTILSRSPVPVNRLLFVRCPGYVNRNTDPGPGRLMRAKESPEIGPTLDVELNDNNTLTFTGTDNHDIFQIHLEVGATHLTPILHLQNSAMAAPLTLTNYNGF
jgi:hypothetical protein